MVLFLWAAALEYVDSTQSKAGQGSSEEAVEATGNRERNCGRRNLAQSFTDRR